MYSFLSTGSVSIWNWRQYGHVIDAYCTMVTGASLRPSDISGNSPGCMMSAMVGFAITSRRPTCASGCSLKGLKLAGVSTVAPVCCRDAVFVSVAPLDVRPPSVGTSPEHPASAAATITADRMADKFWRPGNTPSLSALGFEGLLEVLERDPVELLAVDEERRRRVDP